MHSEKTLPILAFLALTAAPCLASAAQPSFDCSKVEDGSTEAMICGDDELAALDVELSRVYKKALETVPSEEAATLKATQRGWIKGRDESWKADDPREHVKFSYQSRIVELKIQTGEAGMGDQWNWKCEGGDLEYLTSVFYKTDPAAAVLTSMSSGDQTIAIRVPTASGSRYQAPGVDFWAKDKEATLEWFGTQLKCALQGRGSGE